jgi:Asp-tRNA(Asn)/Glu-tRNA(Gln) amidotransferase C subunit
MDRSNKPERLSAHVRQLKRILGTPDQIKEVDEAEFGINTDVTEEAKAYFEKLRRERDPVTLSAKSLLDNLVRSGYEIDSDNELIVKGLCLYFAGDARMTSPKYNLNPDKGIALLGGLGVGKTWLMKLLRYNAHLPFAFGNCSSIADEVEQGGSENLARYFRVAKTGASYLYYGKTEIGFCFNELGREAIPVKYFGNPTNVMERIIFTRYENEVPHNFTHFTSNKSPEEITKLYGDYIGNRMLEMFNVVIFPENAKSRRK